MLGALEGWLMRMTMAARREVLRVTAGRYQRARKREKSKILDEFIETTGYSRWHASRWLRYFGRRVRLNEKLILRGSLAGRKVRSGRRRGRGRLLSDAGSDRHSHDVDRDGSGQEQGGRACICGNTRG